MSTVGNGPPRVPVERGGTVVFGMLLIVATGVALGAAHNQLTRGLPWIAEDRTKDVPRLEEVVGGPDGNGAAPASEAPAKSASQLEYSDYSTDETDPMAIGSAPPTAGPDLPEIPDLGRPIMIQLGAAKQFHDARAAVFVDAREADEYEDEHIAGAINLPYDLAVSDPSRLQLLDTGGRPIIAYCGGGACETSLQLAHELMFMGQHEKVLVYEGGLPEWIEAGYPVARGSGG